MKNIVIALDAMGGDRAPSIVLEGAQLFIAKYPKVAINFRIFGNKEVITPLLSKYKKLVKNMELIHTVQVISNHDKPSEVIRSLKESSMHLAIKSVRDKKAHAVVSAGNTGALMAISKIYLKMLEGIERPAIITCVPTRKEPCALLDLGANAESSMKQLVQFAIMGSAFIKSYLEIDNPKVGLLNIGSESLKGNELVQKTADILQSHKEINYIGFAEGTDIFTGKFDVIVTDGFSGNVVLKAIEGLAKFMLVNIKGFISQSIISRVIGLLAIPLLLVIKKVLDTRKYNGAMLIGLNGICIKSHGNADAVSFANAIEVAVRLVRNNLNDKIKTLLDTANTENF